MATPETVPKSGPLETPVYVRVSKASELFGIGRTTLFSLIKSRQIKSVLLKQKKGQSGIRLISFESLKGYLDSLSEGGEG